MAAGSSIELSQDFSILLRVDLATPTDCETGKLQPLLRYPTRLIGAKTISTAKSFREKK